MNSEIRAPSFQASSSTSKRSRIEEEDKEDEVLQKQNKQRLINRLDLVPEKKDCVLDESSMNKSATESQELANITAVIHNHLTCSSCDRLPRARPLMLCSSGHVTCSSCYQLSRSLLQCTQSGCQLLVTEHPASDLVWSLLGEITRPCSWAHHGCGHRGPLTDLQTHEPRCVFQEVECGVCGSYPSLTNFHNHSTDLACFQGRTIHNLDKAKTSLFMSVSSGRHPPLAVLYQDCIFFIQLSRIKSRSVWVASVAGQMVKEDCSRFQVSLDLRSLSDKSAPSFSFSGPPCSLTSSVEAILKDGNCLVLTDPAVSNIIGGRIQERNLLVNLSIDNVKSKTCCFKERGYVMR